MLCKTNPYLFQASVVLWPDLDSAAPDDLQLSFPDDMSGMS